LITVPRKAIIFSFNTLLIQFKFTLRRISQIAISQDSLDTRFSRNYKNSLGIYTNTFLASSFGNSGTLYPYRLNYRRFSGTNALRIGFNTRFDRNRINDFDTNDNTIFMNGFFSFRIGAGYERYHQIGKRFHLYYGGELNTYYRRDKDVATNLTVETTEIEQRNDFGIAPLLGLEIRIISRLSIGTEFLWNFGISSARSKTSIDNIGASSQESTTSSTNFFSDFRFPRGITLRFNF